jgi:hypothetical protein
VIRVEPPDVHFLEKPPPGYKPDMGSARRLEEVIAKTLAKGQRGKEFSLTVEGMFYSGGAKPDPSERPRHRWYPGYIVVQAYRDVKPL